MSFTYSGTATETNIRNDSYKDVHEYTFYNNNNILSRSIKHILQRRLKLVLLLFNFVFACIILLINEVPKQNNNPVSFLVMSCFNSFIVNNLSSLISDTP